MSPLEVINAQRRFVLIIVVLGMLPAAGPGLRFLKDRFWKLSATELQAELMAKNMFGVRRPESNLQCLDGVRGWDYVCTFSVSSGGTETRRQIGVRVGSDRITAVSTLHAPGARFMGR